MTDEAGPAGAGTPQFICDAMLGGLAKWLRAAGYSAEFDIHIQDGEIVRRCLAEGKIVLTSDSRIMDRYAVAHGLVGSVFIPRKLSPVEQLGHVMKVLGLPLRPSRCMECNGQLVDVSPEDVGDEVPPKVLRWCKRFFRCSGCGKVFWRGTHWRSISKQLRQARALACDPKATKPHARPQGKGKQ